MNGRSSVGDGAAVRSELRGIYDRLLSARGPIVEELTSRARRLERQAGPPRTVGRVDEPANDRLGASASASGAVCFQIIDHEVMAFVVGDAGTEVVRKLCEPSQIDQLLSRLVVQWRRFEHPAVVARHFDLVQQATLEVLQELHACLLAPLAGHVPEAGPLTIVADGPVGAVPFAALHDGDRYLAQRVAVRQTPSLRIDRLLRRRRRSVSSVLSIGASDGVAPMAAVEAERVGHAWAASGREALVLVDQHAEARALLGGAAEHDVVHVAGHGLFRDDSPEFSALRLADRWVTAAEISRLDLNGQLVVLARATPVGGTPRGPCARSSGCRERCWQQAREA